MTIELDPKTEAVFRRKGYRIDRALNEGAFGQVYAGIKTDSKEAIAIKVMDLKAVGEKFKSKFLPRELSALIGVKHANVVFIYDIFRANNKIYVFMEYANGGDLAGYLAKNGAIAEPITCYWFTQCTRALEYIHRQLGIAHRDIKIDNVLLHNHQAKVTDFGFAKEVWDEGEGGVVLSTTYCGTEPYYSPQIVKRVPYDAFKADSWAMGVTLFAMLNNRFPFHYEEPKQMLDEQMDPDYIPARYVKHFPADLRNLQESLFEVDETKRLSMAQILIHPWIERKGKPKPPA